MLKIRLQRVGRKNDASFRLVVTDSHNGPQSGKFLEVLGSYDPKQDKTSLKADRVKHWMSVGAQVSDTAHNILVSEKLVDGKKVNVLPKKQAIKKEGEEVETKSPEAPKAAETPAAEEPKAEEVKEEVVEEKAGE